MTDIEKKLHKLKSCLGEKKLKQIGLIPCSTCQDIMTNALSLHLSPDLKKKPFLTAAEIATINEAILGSINTTPQEDLSSSNDSSDSLVLDTPNSNETETTTLEDSNSSNPADAASSSGSNFEISPELIASLNTTPTQTEQELITKLLAILSQSHPPIHTDLGMGYTYTPPTIQSPHSLICSECGRLYTLSHPDLKLLPLPVYLSDTEYEMIKGVYVDILL